MKRGQVTYFLLLALIIFLAFGFVSYIKNSSSSNIKTEIEKESFGATPSAQVKNYVENCLNLVSEEAVQILGWQGGHIIYQPDSLITSYSVLSYAYDEGKNRLPAKSQMEDEISLYVNFALDYCLNNFTAFNGYQIEASKSDTTTIIQKDSVFVKTHYPIAIKVGDASATISDFSTIVPVRLGYLHEVLEEIIKKHQEDNGWIPVSYMSDFNLTMNIYPYNETNIVYEIIDNQSLINNKPYRFLFANRFAVMNFLEDFA